MTKAKIKLLFVCACNCNRSPAFEREMKIILPKKHPEINWEIKSAGVYVGYPNVINNELLSWADKVFVMDLGLRKNIERRFPLFMNKIEVIGISDQYDVDDAILKELVHYWYEKFFFISLS